MSKIGPIVSMIGGIWIVVVIIVLVGIYTSLGYAVPWAWPSSLPYRLLTGIVAIGGVIIRFKNIKVGSIILLIIGLFYPIFVVIFTGPEYLLYMFLSVPYLNYIEIPILILLIGGIIGFIEWRIQKQRSS